MTSRQTVIGTQIFKELRWMSIILLITIIPHTKMEPNQKIKLTTEQPAITIHEDIKCPSFAENSACPCYKFDDGKLNNLFQYKTYSFLN